MVKVIAFDLDGTLTKSKQKITKETVKQLNRLSKKYIIVIISGGPWKEFKNQFLKHAELERAEKFILMPTSGASMYIYNGLYWKKEYEYKIPFFERRRIKNILNKTMKTFRDISHPIYGDLVEDRKSQITYSVLGQEAPLNEKIKWANINKNINNKSDMALFLQIRLPRYEIREGGTTSIDITMKNIDKAFGIKKLIQLLRINTDNIIFIGDRIHIGGNDYPVYNMGVTCVETTGPAYTNKIIKDILTKK